MHSAKEKISNTASAAKEHINIGTAKVEEKAEKATARTPEEKAIAHEHRKAEEGQAKMELHQAKAEHAQEKLGAKHGHHHHTPLVGTQHGQNDQMVGTQVHQPVGAPATMAGTNVPTYPLGGHPPAHNKHM